MKYPIQQMKNGESLLTRAFMGIKIKLQDVSEDSQRERRICKWLTMGLQLISTWMRKR